MISFGLGMKRKEKKERSFGWGEYLLRIEKFLFPRLVLPSCNYRGSFCVFKYTPEENNSRKLIHNSDCVETSMLLLNQTLQ